MNRQTILPLGSAKSKQREWKNVHSGESEVPESLASGIGRTRSPACKVEQPSLDVGLKRAYGNWPFFPEEKRSAA